MIGLPRPMLVDKCPELDAYLPEGEGVPFVPGEVTYDFIDGLLVKTVKMELA